MNKQLIEPVGAPDRIISLDVLRGFAVLGILVMNVQSFSMISAAYINPTAYGDLTGINKWVWISSHIFADQKFLTLFSLLFGAAHAYLFWYGDILFSYALCALVAILFRNLSPKVLFISGLIVFSIASLIYLFFGLSWNFMPPEAHQGIQIGWMPTSEMIDKEIAAYRSGWLGQMFFRFRESINFQTFIFLIYTGWRAGGLMLMGMAFFKWGILTNERSTAYYIKLSLICFLIGIPLIVLGIIRNFDAGWTAEYSMFFGWQYNYWGSLMLALSYIGIILLISKRFEESKLIQAVAAVGRLALTNYLLQTFICTFIFYGHGLGLYGSIDRWLQLIIVAVIWIFQLVASPIWLRYYQFGPAEWMWRSLTYGRFQAMR
jgi:uncharacterized protein